MSVSTIGVVLESAEGERRVALSPDGVQRLRKAGHEVLVETGAGGAAWFPDSEYEVWSVPAFVDSRLSRQFVNVSES